VDTARPSAGRDDYGRMMTRSRVRRICCALLLLVIIVPLGGAPQAHAAEPATVVPLLDSVLASVDDYWHETQAAAGLPAPSVGHIWVAPGAKVDTACGAQADDDSAFYCATDDTIYIGQAFAEAIRDGVANGLPGERAGFGRAAGDFAVAFVVAHEYAHNVQNEDGVLVGRSQAMPTELNADCLAGTWAHWDNDQGGLAPGDLQEALDAALAVGDFDFANPQHHGTPLQRREALLTGFRGGTPQSCAGYLQF
jgi:predicted metalloprotease